MLYEVLLRWKDGTFSGAHVSNLERILDDDGTTVLAEKQTAAAGISGDDLTAVLGQALIDALARNVELEAQVATLTAQVAAITTETAS